MLGQRFAELHVDLNETEHGDCDGKGVDDNNLKFS